MREDAVISKLLTIGTWLLGLGLIALAISTLIDPESAAQGYGVALEPTMYVTEQDEFLKRSMLDAQQGRTPSAIPYVVATGMRDLTLGAMTLLILIRHRNVLPGFLACMAILPICDIAIVGFHGDGRLVGLMPHIVGTVGVIGLAILARLERRTANEASPTLNGPINSAANAEPEENPPPTRLPGSIIAPEAGGEITLSLNRILSSSTHADLGFEPSEIPPEVMVTLPVDTVRNQLPTGRVVLPVTTIAEGCEERYRPAFAKAKGGLLVEIPIQEIVDHLPNGNNQLE